MSILRLAVPLLLVILLMGGAGEPPDNAIVAQRGDIRLTGADLRDALSLLDPAVRAQVTATPSALTNFTRERLLNLSVLAEAREKKWDTQTEVARRMNEARDAVVLQSYLASVVPPDPAYPSDAEIAAAYENNKSRLLLPRQFHLAQIVLTVKPDTTPREEEEVRKRAMEFRAQAVRPKADFAAIARQNSQERQSAEKGGDVGWLREPDMVPSVREVVADLSANEISQPVRAPGGWHVLKLLETKPAGQIPLADAKPQIVAALRQARGQRLMRAYLDDMLKAQPIQVNEIELTRQMGTVK